MKTTDSKTSHSEASAPSSFFNKGAEGSFFSKTDGKGNSFFQASGIQASLTVGAPDDPFEKEADKVARQVVDGFDQASSIQRKLSNFGLQQFMIQPFAIGSRISRKLQKTLFRTPLFVQAKCAHCEEEEKMQQKSGDIQFAGEGALVSADVESKIQSMRGSGQPMDGITQTAMESSFGADFSAVRVHANSQAVQMSQQLNAHAFTVGNDIFFNQGRYQPSTKEGAGLLAHELTHTVQQGASVQNKRINRQSLLNSLSGHTTAHLAAMNGGSTLNRKEIAQLQQLPEEEMMKMQQLQMLQMKGVDEVQKKENVGTLRRCNGGGTPATPISFTSASFTPPTSGAISTANSNASNAVIDSSAIAPSGEVEVTGGTDAEAQDWEAGFIQTNYTLLRQGHYIGSKTQKLRTASTASVTRDALVVTGEPWYDPNNTNGKGRVGFSKTGSKEKVDLWDAPSTSPPWDTPDGKGKLDKTTGKDTFTAWMIARKKTAPNTIYYLNWASWEFDCSVDFNYALPPSKKDPAAGTKTTKKINGSTTVTGSGAGKGANAPTLSGTTTNNSITVVWT
jgi:hypothetical protein